MGDRIFPGLRAAAAGRPGAAGPDRTSGKAHPAARRHGAQRQLLQRLGLLAALRRGRPHRSQRRPRLQPLQPGPGRRHRQPGRGPGPHVSGGGRPGGRPAGLPLRPGHGGAAGLLRGDAPSRHRAPAGAAVPRLAGGGGRGDGRATAAAGGTSEQTSVSSPSGIGPR